MKSLIKKVLLSGIALAGLCVVIMTVTAEAKTKHTVTFMYGTKMSVQEVVDGGNAIIPTDTAVVGYTFLGWTDSAANVKSDKLILGMYVNNTPYAVATNSSSNVKKVNNNTSAPFLPWWDGTKGVPGVTCVVRWYNGHNDELWKTEVVPYGSSLPDPQDPCISGYEFVGWEGSWKNITEDRAIKAYYYHLNKVTFYDGLTGAKYDEKWVRDGDSAYSEPPYHPGHWYYGAFDRSLSNITSDINVTALYDVKP